MTLTTLYPAEGRRVRKPDGALLDPDGEPVALTSFWRRRLKDGDVLTAPASSPAGTAPDHPVALVSTGRQED